MKTLLLTLGLFAFASTTQQQITDDIPEINQQIVQYCKDQMGKKISRGECWDLAQGALDHVDADWQSPWGFGDEIDPDSTAVLPGDIVQFYNVKIASDGGESYFPQHTAIVIEVISEGVYTIAHQNFNNVRKVTSYKLEAKRRTKGTLRY